MTAPIKLTEREQTDMNAELAAWAETWQAFWTSHDGPLDEFQQVCEREIDRLKDVLLHPDRTMSSVALSALDEAAGAGIASWTLLKQGYFWCQAYDHRVNAIRARYLAPYIERIQAEARAQERAQTRNHPFHWTDRDDFPSREPLEL
jgi:hypothetical protein